MTSYRIMKTSEFEDSIFYQASCDCGSKDHNIVLELEQDKEFSNMLFLNMYMTLRWNRGWRERLFITRACRRIKAALRLLFTGYLEVDESFIFNGEDHILEFISALNEGLQKLQRERYHAEK